MNKQTRPLRAAFVVYVAANARRDFALGTQTGRAQSPVQFAMKHAFRPSQIVILALALCALIAPLAHARRDPLPSTLPADVALQRQFAALWEQRFTRDVSAELLPFLDARETELAQRAVRALGRLENPDVLPELQKRRDTQEALDIQSRTNPEVRLNRYLNFDIAIARIESHGLHGREKIEFALQKMPWHWTWKQAIYWSEKVSDPKNYLADRPEFGSVREIVDMLYTMSKSGEDIEPLRQQFTFTKAQNVQLNCAKLPVEEEVATLLDYSQSLDFIGMDDEYVCESHLLSLGEPARVALAKRLEWLAETKPEFANRYPFLCMLRAAGMSGDPKFIPILQRFSEAMRDVAHSAGDAQQAKRLLESDTGFSYAPQ